MKNKPVGYLVIFLALLAVAGCDNIDDQGLVASLVVTPEEVTLKPNEKRILIVQALDSKKNGVNGKELNIRIHDTSLLSFSSETDARTPTITKTTASIPDGQGIKYQGAYIFEITATAEAVSYPATTFISVNLTNLSEGDSPVFKQITVTINADRNGAIGLITFPSNGEQEMLSNATANLYIQALDKNNKGVNGVQVFYMLDADAPVRFLQEADREKQLVTFTTAFSSIGSTNIDGAAMVQVEAKPDLVELPKTVEIFVGFVNSPAGKSSVDPASLKRFLLTIKSETSQE
jgi:hypothetical protein